MCGLTGFAIHPKSTGLVFAKELFSAGLATIECRGGHATGLAAIGGSDPFIFKWAETYSKIKDTALWTGAIDRIKDDVEVVIGHTRYATLPNAEKDEAAHPFRQGRVVGAHNGLIRNWREIESRLKPEKPYIVDSEAIFGILDAFKKPGEALSHLEGSFALSWTKLDTSARNSRKHRPKLYLCRQPGSVLTVAYIPKIRLLVWNSLESNLVRIMKDAGVTDDEYMKWNPKECAVYEYDVTKFTEKGTNVVKYEDAWKPNLGRINYSGGHGNTSKYRTAITGENSVRPFKPRDEVLAESRTSSTSEVTTDLGRAVPRTASPGQITLAEVRKEIDDLWRTIGIMRKRYADKLAEYEEQVDDLTYELETMRNDFTILWNEAAAAGVNVIPDGDYDRSKHLSEPVEELDPDSEPTKAEIEQMELAIEEEQFLAEQRLFESETEEDGWDDDEPYTDAYRAIAADTPDQPVPLCEKCKTINPERGVLLPAAGDTYIHEKCIIEDALLVFDEVVGTPATA